MKGDVNMTKAKKSIAFITAMAVVCLAFGLFAWHTNKPSGESALAASAEQILTLQIGNPQMTVDGESVNIDDSGTVPVIIDERTLLPVRAVVEAVGGTVEWDGDTRTTTLTYKSDVIKLTIDSTTAYLNDAAQTLDVTPVIINDRTMLPIRFIAESFKFTVDWNANTQTVTITVPADAQTPDATAPNTDTASKSVVVYFSATNTTEGVAQKIADYTGADLFELEPKEPYTDDDLDWTDDNSRVVKEHNDLDNTDVELVTTDVPNWDSYNTVYIGAPIWWQEFSWVIDEFVENTDFTGKTVVPFCTSMSSGLGDSAKHLAEKTTTGTWLDGMRFGSSATDEQVQEWIDSLDLPASGGTGTTAAASTVYMTTDITPEALVEIYDKLGFEPEGNVAVKMSTGEPPNSNYLRPELIGDLVKKVDGTIVECNTAYGGSRSETAMHEQVIKDHELDTISKDGFVDIMDRDGSKIIPVPTPATGASSTITENYVGAHLENYDSLISLAHFKGHAMAGYGGAIKNMSIGIGSQEGKCLIHTGGQSHDSPWGGDQDKFLESMGDATSSVVNFLDGKVVYINVMNRLSVDCDCDGNPAEPDMHDIGILASYDPVALDQACLDLVYAQKDGDGASLVNRIESRNGLHTLEHAAEIGLGSREYNLVSIDS